MLDGLIYTAAYHTAVASISYIYIPKPIQKPSKELISTISCQFVWCMPLKRLFVVILNFQRQDHSMRIYQKKKFTLFEQHRKMLIYRRMLYTFIDMRQNWRAHVLFFFNNCRWHCSVESRGGRQNAFGVSSNVETFHSGIYWKIWMQFTFGWIVQMCTRMWDILVLYTSIRSTFRGHSDELFNHDAWAWCPSLKLTRGYYEARLPL